MPTLSNNQPVLFTRQRHEADRAGLHYDYRMVVGDVAHSWATKKPLPEDGQAIVLWEQPIHTAHYALSERVEIPKGQYGAGVTTLDFVRKGKIVHPDETGTKFSLHLNDGKRFLFRKLPDAYGKGGWLFKALPDTKPGEKTASITKFHTTQDKNMNKYLQKIASDLEVAKEYESDEKHDINKYTNALNKVKNPDLKAAIQYALPQEKQHAKHFAKAVKQEEAKKN